MREHHWIVTIGIASLLLAAALLAACGADDLEEAREELTRIEGRVERARETLEKRKHDADAAEDALEEARRELEKAERQLAEAQKGIAEHADDALLFREVQGRLLEDDDLEEVAISADVKDRVVTLEGSVPDEALKKRAGEIARGVGGVETVVNRIQVEVPAKRK